MNDIVEFRNFLKDTLRKTIDFRTSDQHRGVPCPPLEEEVDESLARISLADIDSCRLVLPKTDLIEAIAKRRSRRKYNDENLGFEELSFLLWATQGQRNPEKETPHFRTVPSAGARHSFETYIIVQRVEKIPQGVYRYLPLTHELVYLDSFDAQGRKRLDEAVFGQRFAVDSAALFIWTTVPYRMEWRYLQSAHRVILLDAGHVCQNLYLGCEAIQAGTCAIAAYDQEAMDELLGIDGQDQFTIYLAPVGKY